MMLDKTSKRTLYIRYVQNIYNFSDYLLMRSLPRQHIRAAYDIYMASMKMTNNLSMRDIENYEKEFYEGNGDFEDKEGKKVEFSKFHLAMAINSR